MDRTRISTGLADLDLLLGGGTTFGENGVVADYGLRRPSVTLLYGAPGVGKTTTLLQIGGHVARGGARVAYATGDCTGDSIRSNVERLKVAHGNLMLRLGVFNLESLEKDVSLAPPAVLLVDRLQAIGVEGLKRGTAASGLAVVMRLKRMSAIYRMCIVCVGAETKDGSLAGSAKTPHTVDAVVRLQREGAACAFTSKRNRYGLSPGPYATTVAYS